MKVVAPTLINNSSVDAFETVIKGLSTFCAGSPIENEYIGGGESQYAFTINSGNCAAKAVTAATASTVFTIKKNGSSIGTITFAAAATTGTFNFSNTSIAIDDFLTIQAPATPDTTLSDINIVVRN